jgi:hypothetical protein
MNERSPEISRRQRLIDVLATEATALVLNHGHSPRSAINAAMNTYRGDVLDQRQALFGPVIQAVERSIQAEAARKDASQKRRHAADLRYARMHEENLLKGFDGEDRPFDN